MLKFSDSVEFDLEGDYRVEFRHDGAYVVGNGVLISVKNKEEGEMLILQLKGARYELQ